MKRAQCLSYQRLELRISNDRTLQIEECQFTNKDMFLQMCYI